MSTTYKRIINGDRYFVHIHEGLILTVVKVTSRNNSDWGTTYAKRRKIFDDDVESLAAKTLSEAVSNHEESVKNRRQHEENIEQALDIVEEEYDG